jgi:hypothetical protein
MNKSKITDILGYILITPAVLSVPFFLYDLLTENRSENTNLSWIWTGYGENHTSSLPLYYGLMAFAGAYLLKEKKN